MNRLYITITSLVFGLVMVMPVYAMESLTDDMLGDITGQAGADLSLKMVLNQDNNANFVCANLVYCRLAMSLNNRYQDGSQDTYDVNGNRIPSPTGKKQWLVFKGIQGTINIPELKLDGEDVSYGATTQAALKFGFTATKPIEIRNFGFQSLSMEIDTVANEGAGNVPGYLTPATLYGGGGFDSTKEKGFLGLNMNANLSLTGSIKMFSCSSGHPRC